MNKKIKLILFFAMLTFFEAKSATVSEDEQIKKISKKHIFDKKVAATYDEKTGEIKESLFASAKKILEGESDKAKVLCVGAGTGAEIISFARSFPEWTFIAVDPSADMLEQARKKIEDLDISSRVKLHIGTLDTLPDSEEKFDIATSILVSHFVGGEDKRIEFFKTISDRLKPGGILITADLVTDTAGVRGLVPAWLRVLKEAGFPHEDLESRGEVSAEGEEGYYLPVENIKTLISKAGFNEPLQFYQWLYIHAFTAKKIK